MIAKEHRDFVDDDTSFFDFDFDFNFNDLIDKSLSIHFLVYSYEIVVRNEKICDEEIVNIRKIIHEVKIHFSRTKSVFVVYSSKIVVENA